MKKITPTKSNLIKYMDMPQEIRDLVHIPSNDVTVSLYQACNPTVETIIEHYDNCKEEGQTFEEFVADAGLEIIWWIAQNYQFTEPELGLMLEVCW